MKPKRIILASKSPRRKEILNQMGIDPQIVVSNFDESCVEEVRPQKLEIAEKEIERQKQLNVEEQKKNVKLETELSAEKKNRRIRVVADDNE